MGLRALHEKESSSQLLEIQTQKIAEQSQQILELSSANSELMNELQTKSAKIVELNEQIERLNAADKVLQENAKLQKALKEAEAAVSKCKAETAREIKSLAVEHEETEKKRKEFEKLKAAYKILINEEAQKITAATRADLETEYRSKFAGIRNVLYGSIAYGSICTVLAATRAEAFKIDLEAFLYSMGSFVLWLVKIVLTAANSVADLPYFVSNGLAADIIHWILFLAVTAVGGGCALIVIGWVSIKILLPYTEYADVYTAVFALTTLAIAVFWGDNIRVGLHVNLILMALVANLAFVWARYKMR